MPIMTRTDVSLSAGQAAGTSAVVTSNPNRTTLIIGNLSANAGRVNLADASGGYGMPIPALGVMAFGMTGYNYTPGCPTEAVFVGGLSAGDKVSIWEA